MQPVHSWKWSQITEGFSFFAAIALATWAAAAYGMPTAASAMVQTRMKSRRSTESLPAAVSSLETRTVEAMASSCRAPGRRTRSRKALGVEDCACADRRHHANESI